MLLLMVKYVLEFKIISSLVIIKGNYTISIKASPMLFDVIVQAAKMVSTNIISVLFL